MTVIAHQKGADAKEMAYRNFGMPHPEGYRKALRLMKMAEVFKKPILTMIDTPGAFPGVGAEERGQAEAIARNLKMMVDCSEHRSSPSSLEKGGVEGPWPLEWETEF